MPDAPDVTLKVAADAFGVDVATVQRWVIEGAPTVRLGSRGPGNGTLVNIVDLRKWRVERAAGLALETAQPDFSAVLSRGLVRSFKRGTKGATDPTWMRLTVRRGRAALIHADIYTSLMFEATGREPEWEELPKEIVELLEVAHREMREILRQAGQ